MLHLHTMFKKHNYKNKNIIVYKGDRNIFSNYTQKISIKLKCKIIIPNSVCIFNFNDDLYNSLLIPNKNIYKYQYFRKKKIVNLIRIYSLHTCFVVDTFLTDNLHKITINPNSENKPVLLNGVLNFKKQNSLHVKCVKNVVFMHSIYHKHITILKNNYSLSFYVIHINNNKQIKQTYACLLNNNYNLTLRILDTMFVNHYANANANVNVNVNIDKCRNINKLNISNILNISKNYLINLQCVKYVNKLKIINFANCSYVKSIGTIISLIITTCSRFDIWLLKYIKHINILCSNLTNLNCLKNVHTLKLNNNQCNTHTNTFLNIHTLEIIINKTRQHNDNDVSKFKNIHTLITNIPYSSNCVLNNYNLKFYFCEKLNIDNFKNLNNVTNLIFENCKTKDNLILHNGSAKLFENTNYLKFKKYEIKFL